MKWPHDDTQSLVAFYGDPRKRGFTDNLVLVKPPWRMTYEGKSIKGVQIHRKCAASLKSVFDEIWEAVDQDPHKLPPGAVNFSGSYNFRPVRGSSRLSCHAFGAAIDLDAERNPMNSRGSKGTMSDIVIDAFKNEGWYWGGDFRSRKDPMHFQAAHEGAQVASLDDTFMPPMTDGHSGDDEDDLAELPAEVTKPPVVPVPPEEIVPRSERIEQASQAVATGAGVIYAVKSSFRSKMSWLTGGLGSASAGTAVAADPDTRNVFLLLLSKPMFWLALVCLALATYIVYLRWREYGRGNPANIIKVQ